MGKIIEFKKNGGFNMISTNTIPALDIAKWFIKNGYDIPRNDFNGNMKLQKLLYFSQLVHIAKNNEILFNEEMYAFQKGTVVEKIRKEYKYNFYSLLNEANTTDVHLDEKQLATLKIVADIFGSASASELSELNHQNDSWKDSYANACMFGNRPDKIHSKICVDDIYEKDLLRIKKVLDAYESVQVDEPCYVTQNGVRFYFDPSEIEITEGITKTLEEFEAEDDNYSLCLDTEMGLVIY